MCKRAVYTDATLVLKQGFSVHLRGGFLFDLILSLSLIVGDTLCLGGSGLLGGEDQDHQRDDIG